MRIFDKKCFATYAGEGELVVLLREFDQYRLLVYSALLVVTMLFRPQGLLGTKELDLKLLFKKIGKFFKRLFSKKNSKGSDL